MNFQKYEQEVESFLSENYTNLKRSKIKNSESAFKEFLLIEQADINNYASSIFKKIISDVRRDFTTDSNVEKGYELAKVYKMSVEIPHFKKIEISYSDSKSNNVSLVQNTKYEDKDHARTVKNFKEKSLILNRKAIPISVAAGAATTLVSLPSMMLFKPASVATSLTVVGLSAVIVAGLVYVLVSYMDEAGKEQEVYVQPERPVPSSEASPTFDKKTIDQVSLGQLLDLRKAEAEQVLIKKIQDAKKKYEEMQLQLI